MTVETPAVEKVSIAWDALLEVASLEDPSERKRRATVDVPAGVLALCVKAQTEKQRIVLPYDAATYTDLCAVFYSAGDIMVPPASVMITVMDAEGKAVRGKDLSAGKSIRVFIGDRRGAKVKKAAKPVETGDTAPKGDG